MLRIKISSVMKQSKGGHLQRFVGNVNGDYPLGNVNGDYPYCGRCRPEDLPEHGMTTVVHHVFFADINFVILNCDACSTVMPNSIRNTDGGEHSQCSVL